MIILDRDEAWNCKATRTWPSEASLTDQELVPAGKRVDMELRLGTLSSVCVAGQTLTFIFTAI